jgi:hypothetical protein
VTGWLLDTNILSELRRPKPESKVVRFIAAQPIERLFVSVVPFAAIRYVIECAPDPAQRATLHHWLANSVRPMFGGRVLPVSADVMLTGRLLVQGGAEGTAHVLATRFDHCGDRHPFQPRDRHAQYWGFREDWRGAV